MTPHSVNATPDADAGDTCDAATDTDLRVYGISAARAVSLRQSLATLTDWDLPEMSVYDHYDRVRNSSQA